MTEYRETHHSFCRTAIATTKNRTHKKGADLCRWFFEISERRDRFWRTHEAAHLATIPMKDIHECFIEGRKAGLVELTAQGWKWIG